MKQLLGKIFTCVAILLMATSIWAQDVIVTNCANKRPQAYWSINASKNGLGIAYNF